MYFELKIIMNIIRSADNLDDSSDLMSMYHQNKVNNYLLSILEYSVLNIPNTNLIIIITV